MGGGAAVGLLGLALLNLGGTVALLQADGGSLSAWQALLQGLGVPGCLLLFVYGLKAEWWYMAAQVKRERQITDRALAAAERSGGAASAAVELARTAVTP